MKLNHKTPKTHQKKTSAHHAAKRTKTTKAAKPAFTTMMNPAAAPSLIHRKAKRNFSSDKNDDNKNNKKGANDDDEKSIASDDDASDKHPEADPVVALKQRMKQQQQEVDSLKRQLNDQAIIIEEWKSKCRSLQERVKAEIEEQNSIHERSRREISDVKKFAVGKFAKGLLEGVDALEAAAKATEAALERNQDESFVKLAEGLQMTTAIFHKALTAEGIKKYESLGQMVNPDLHFITAQLPHPTAPAGTITHILKEGYNIHERVLRPAQVCVSKADV